MVCGQETFQNVYNFTYIGSEISAGGSVAPEVERRVCLATAKFNALHHVWRDGRLSRALQTALYRVRIVPVLLYGCESWGLSQTICKKIRGFHAQCMKWIFNTDEHTALSKGLGGDILRMAHRRRWLWLGHLLRTPRDRLTRRVFHSRARPQPPYRKGSLQELCPWVLTEAELKAKDQRSWERKFDDIYNA